MRALPNETHVRDSMLSTACEDVEGKRYDVSHIADNDDHNSSNEHDNFLLPSWEKNHMLRHCG